MTFVLSMMLLMTWLVCGTMTECISVLIRYRKLDGEVRAFWRIATWPVRLPFVTLAVIHKFEEFDREDELLRRAEEEFGGPP